MENIIVPAEALYEFLKEEKCNFRSNYLNYKLILGSEFIVKEQDWDYSIDDGFSLITLTKSDFMNLLMNKTLIKDNINLLVLF